MGATVGEGVVVASTTASPLLVVDSPSSSAVTVVVTSPSSLSLLLASCFGPKRACNELISGGETEQSNSNQLISSFLLVMFGLVTVTMRFESAPTLPLRSIGPTTVSLIEASVSK